MCRQLRSRHAADHADGTAGFRDLTVKTADPHGREDRSSKQSGDEMTA